jgi:hypothetical protein
MQLVQLQLEWRPRIRAGQRQGQGAGTPGVIEALLGRVIGQEEAVRYAAVWALADRVNVIELFATASSSL